MEGIKNILNRIKTYFDSKSNIVAVYLFGSYAIGHQKSNSDVDVAVIFGFELNKDERFNRCLEYSFYLSAITGMEIDIVDMNSADFPLLYEIFTEGKIIIEKEREKAVQFKALKMSQYADLKYYENLMGKGLMNHVRNMV